MWLLPSLSRPQNLKRFFDAYRTTGATTPGAVIIDQMDWAHHADSYLAIELPLGWHVWVSNGRTQGEKIAETWERVRDCAWLGLIGDDCVPETPEWDQRLVERLDGANFVSCDDGWLAPKRVANCWVISGDLVRAVGYIFPPGLHHLFVDDVWEMIGRAAGCWDIRMEVKVRHAHVMKGDAPADATHRAVYGDRPDRTGGLWASDETVFQRWRAESFPAVMERVAALRGERAPVTSAEEEARIARVQSRAVMIATPIARHPVRQYTLALAETCVLLARLGVPFYYASVVGSSNLPRARNVLAAKFLASAATDLLFIDDDIGFRANDVVRLLASDQPLIAGVGRKKVDKANTDPDVWCCKMKADATGLLASDAMGNVEVERAGTGFMKIERRVFEEMAAAHPEWKRPGNPEMSAAEKARYFRFFAFGDDEYELGEDYVFCDRWRAHGGKVWIDPSLRLAHVGEKEYAGAIAELMHAVEPAPQFREAAE